MPPADLAIPACGYKDLISIDHAHSLIRTWTAIDAAARDGARLADILDAGNTASDVFVDAAYRSIKNEEMLKERGFVSRIQVGCCRVPRIV
ncbi:hypothetical protein [Beijerinckia indica]|uniref:hypothetical protein n=1 Tax=Beijerinckia indica TaxID=533 RepID=UPI0002E7A964